MAAQGEDGRSSRSGRSAQAGREHAAADLSGPAAVEACELRKSFPVPGGEPIEILHGVSCSMMPGRMTALVGPSGSGKSTALLCLAGLEAATSGRVRLLGRDLGGLPAARVAELYRDRVGFVFQAYNLVPYLTVRENITISDTLAGRRPDPARVRTVLAGLGLEARADASATTLSGGEQQRVALGRVLYRRPPVVFADEPTGALDTRSAAFVLAELRRLADDGAAVVLVTHDLGAAALADTALIMRDGRIVDHRRGASADELLAAVNQTGAAA
ncbi:ABC transporter ATP-binding protein [Actinomyces sp. ZJ308]|uniref:ABC transporter ATP-binding protein n=1 Tax=Actinomyces sp. ZJ308 TaxID=2708342 RepID=UPI001FB91E05|nr:ABC transporter ATP-binding protein [Actinomyces sp. ZJ308]